MNQINIIDLGTQPLKNESTEIRKLVTGHWSEVMSIWDIAYGLTLELLEILSY